MDLPPSGWYPDPYGAPGLLRWWDGVAWTEHTYSEAVHPEALHPEALHPEAQPTTAGSAVTAIEPAVTALELAVTTAGPAATSVDPVVLSATRPPSGPRTSPQPAIPVDYANGTQVLPMDGSGFTGGDGRRRQVLLTAGLTGAAVAAVAVIAVVISNMNASAPPTPANLLTAPATVAASASSLAATTPAASPSPTATTAVTDSTSGLAYQQLPAPWAAGCPGTLNPQAFTWTAGESASAGTINNGQAPWYGEACSGPLPAQYGYTGTADLQNVATTLANGFNGAYYGALPHNFAETGNQPIAVSGHPGWEIKFTQTYTAPQPGQAFTTEAGAVVVTDPGTGAAPEVFFVSVPSNLNEASADALVASLQMPSPPQPAAPASPAASVSPGAPAATAPPPAPGNQGGNNN